MARLAVLYSCAVRTTATLPARIGATDARSHCGEAVGREGERRRLDEALEEARILGDQIPVRLTREGRTLPPTWPGLQEAREERDRGPAGDDRAPAPHMRAFSSAQRAS